MAAERAGTDLHWRSRRCFPEPYPPRGVACRSKECPGREQRGAASVGVRRRGRDVAPVRRKVLVIGYVPERSTAHIQAADPGSRSWSSAQCNLSHFSVPDRPFRERAIGNKFWENEEISMALGAVARTTVPPFLPNPESGG
jgi:hypothetical protein